MQLSKVLLIAVLVICAALGSAQAQGTTPPPTPSDTTGDVVSETVDGVQETVGEILADAETEAETFQVGDDIVASDANAQLEIACDDLAGDDSTAAPCEEILENPAVVREEVDDCCPLGQFCCGMELDCIDLVLAKDVLCPVIGPDSPQKPCCPNDATTGTGSAGRKM